MDFHRRSFLAALGGACLASAGGSILRGEETEKQGLRLGCQSYTYRNFDLEKALQYMQKLGLKYGEFYQKHCPLTDSPARAKAFLNLCKEYGVVPWSWGVQRFTKNHDENRKYFDFAKLLNLKMLSADPTPDSFDSLDKLCEEYKVAVGIHPHGPVGKGLHQWYSAEVILEAVKDHHPLIGSCLDTGHLIRASQLGKKLDPAAQIRLMGKRNFGLHLKDHDNKTNHDVIFGKGSLDVASVIKALQSVSFGGIIAIEYEANPDNPSPDMKACVGIFNQLAKN